jgi:hypothetical protein
MLLGYAVLAGVMLAAGLLLGREPRSAGRHLRSVTAPGAEPVQEMTTDSPGSSA